MSDPNEPNYQPSNIPRTILDDAVYTTPGPSRPAERTELLSDETPPAVMAWLIIVSDGARHGEMFRLIGKSLTIGRADDCEIQLEDRAISRQHAKVRLEGSNETTRYMLHDLATDNGTFVNGDPTTPVELKNGDTIKIGRTELMFKRV
ncbi:FHA domain-containing protein [Candidatus Chloroploca asiatica]|uniref:FHA domain-containing protein n=1 Tax=Candidatus Chloroploca asiatica TaxID=1506545 RepID=A0A2H3L4L6_9CHLR|nr:FHA domain-containing protein [Candidatus Chloroploca asiatica]PDV98106.1 hypothetical protein A9Q02_03225 [Candidatus Chloroploca asiatica]